MERSLNIKKSTMETVQTKILYDVLITLGLVIILAFFSGLSAAVVMSADSFLRMRMWK